MHVYDFQNQDIVAAWVNEKLARIEKLNSQLASRQSQPEASVLWNCYYYT